MNILYNETNHCHKTNDTIICSVCGKKTNRAFVIKDGDEMIFSCMNFDPKNDCMQTALNNHFLKGNESVVCCEIENFTNKKTSKKKRESIGLSLRYKVLKRDGFKCVSCGRSASQIELEIDHKIPVANGGKTTYQNLQTLCFECNRVKGSIH